MSLAATTWDRSTSPALTAKSTQRCSVLVTSSSGIPGEAMTSSISAPTSRWTRASSVRRAAVTISESPIQMFGLNTAARPSSLGTSRTRFTVIRQLSARSAASSPYPEPACKAAWRSSGWIDVARMISSAARCPGVTSSMPSSRSVAASSSAFGGM